MAPTRSRKRILILDGNPGQHSLSRSLAEAYGEAARAAGHEVRLTHLSDLSFDADFGGGGYADPKPLEPELEAMLAGLEWAEHVVLVTPMWWGGIPAKLKGLFDRILLPGRAFDTRRLTRFGMPSPMLTGRTARLVLTSDTPNWFLRWVYGNAVLRQMRAQIFGFVGIAARHSHFAGATHPKTGMVECWLGEMQKLGAQAA